MARITTLLSSAALLAVCSQNAGAGTTMETKGNAFPPLPSMCGRLLSGVPAGRWPMLWRRGYGTVLRHTTQLTRM